MNLLAAHHLLVFTLCSRQVSPSHPEKAAHHQHEKQKLRKGQNGKHSVEYEVGLVKKDNGGLAYHLTFTKKAPRAKLAETDIPEEGDQDYGAAGEGDQVEGDQVDERIDRYTEYWYGAPPLQESVPKRESGNGGRFKPQIISYAAAGKGNEEGGEQQDHKLQESDPNIEIGNGGRFKPQKIIYEAVGKVNEEGGEQQDHKLKESVPKIEIGNGGRFKPQKISYAAAGKVNEEGGEQQDHELKINREHQLHFLPTSDALKGSSRLDYQLTAAASSATQGRKRSDHRKI